MRTSPRPRHHLHPAVLTVMRPALRYSYTREAYVLRGIGNRYGPVFQRRAGTQTGEAGPAHEPVEHRTND